MRRLALIVTLATAPLATPIAGAETLRLRLEPMTFVAADGTQIAAERGELRVPENRSKPDSRTLTLSLVRFKATGGKPGSPIVYLAGGPGGSGIEAARGSRLPLFLALREFGDVIALDQRGTGLGSGDDAESDCDERYEIDFGKPLDRRSAAIAMAPAFRQCLGRLEKSGFDLAGYTTEESAADLEDLRRALGAEKLTLWGISYGTHLALATLKTFPTSIDRVILAGIEGLDDTLKLPSDQQELLATIAQLARPQVPDLLASMREVLRQLEASPKTVTLTHPLTGESGPIGVGALDFQTVIANMLTGPETFAGLPDFVARLAAGDWTALALLAASGRFGEVPIAMTVGMDCASGASVERRARIVAEAGATLLGDAINLPFPELCHELGIPELGQAFRAPVRSSVPALLISGTLDGRTRPRQAEELLPGLPNAVHLVIEGAGHSDPLFLSSPKILDSMKAFLRGEALSERRIVLPPVQFRPVRQLAEVPAATLARYVGEYQVGAKGIRRVFLAGSILYTLRPGSMPFPLRPISATEFFYEGIAGALRFETDASGKVLAMWFRGADGKEERCARR
jgi:pimeloyl-ACP methyl ester carboxylesterase